MGDAGSDDAGSGKGRRRVKGALERFVCQA